eukprot:Awhi_evm1s6543
MNTTFMSRFYLEIGQDDCTKFPCLNGGICSDPDREENGVYQCDCSKTLFDGDMCDLPCTCPAGERLTAECTVTTAVQCEECPSNSFCVAGVATECSNGTFIEGYSCTTCPIGSVCTAGLEGICPDGFSTYET